MPSILVSNLFMHTQSWCRTTALLLLLLPNNLSFTTSPRLMDSPSLWCNSLKGRRLCNNNQEALHLLSAMDTTLSQPIWLEMIEHRQPLLALVLELSLNCLQSYLAYSSRPNFEKDTTYQRLLNGND